MKEKIRKSKEDFKAEMLNEWPFFDIDEIVITLTQIQLMENIYSVKTIKELKQVLIQRLKEHANQLKTELKDRNILSETSEKKMKETVEDVENFIKKLNERKN